MRDGDAAAQLLKVCDLREFFRDALHDALHHQHVSVDDHTEHYVVNMLAMFARADALFEAGEDGLRLKPLVLLFTEALEAETAEQRFRSLQRLGDVSLFMAGFFANGFARKLVDVDYHIAMGGRAYGALAESAPRGPRRALAKVFAELASKFQPLVDALNEISESAYQHSQRDVLRLYELWQKTGSERARRILLRLGVQPVAARGGAH
jgi:hypothetical protein